MARGHVRRRGEAWEVRITAGRDEKGKRRTITRTVHGSEDDAEAKLTEMLRERDTGSAIDPSKTTVAQYLDQWVSEIQVEPTTLQRYKGLIDHQIKAHLGNAILQELTTAAVKTWHKTLRERGGFQGKPLADNSVLQAHRVLGKALGDAKEIRLINSNPASDVSQPKVRDKKDIVILTGTQPRDVIERLASKSHELHPIVALGLATGMRRGELLALNWPNVDLDRGTVRVEGSLEELKDGSLRFKEPKTKSGRRTITIPPVTVQMLRDHRTAVWKRRLVLGLGKAPNDALVFEAIDGGPMSPSKMSKAWKRACKSLGLPVVPFHVLRHTHASALIAAKEDIVKISRRLGHSSPTVTLSIYAHFFEQDDSSAALAIARVLG
jgi:integrase